MISRGLTVAIVLVGLASSNSASIASAACPETIFRACKCPAECADSYCETACVLIGERERNGQISCVRTCSRCGCYGYGQADCSPKPMFGLLGLLASSAEAAEGEQVQLEKGDRQFSNGDGDFLVTESVPATEEPVGMVGLRVTKGKEWIEIAGVAETGPAAKAGLNQGDLVLSIDGNSTKGMALERATKALRGKPGTMVVLRVQKKAGGKPLKLSLVRSADALSQADQRLSIKELTLKDLKSATCPKTSAGCNFLYEEKGSCVYTCRKDQGK